MIFKYSLSSSVLFLFILSTGCDDSSTTSPNEEVGIIPSGNLETARKYALEDNLGRALLIWHDGEVILEEYRGDNFDGHQLHTIFSGSKSFAGILAAIAVKNGLFEFDTTLGELIPEWDPESERGKVTIRQLLSLTSGIETASAGISLTAKEWLNMDMQFERGTTFAYGPTPFYIFSWIFVEVFDINPIDYLEEHLFSPLGVGTGEWINVDGVYPNLAFGGRYPALDWLRIGIMLANGGSIDGTEIIPENLLNELLIPSGAEPGYGITFWVNTPVGRQKRSEMDIPGLAKYQNTEKMISDVMPTDLFMKSGFLGQKLYVCASLNLVIVRFGISPISDEEYFVRLMDGVDQTTLQ